jgi:hypothetical protein
VNFQLYIDVVVLRDVPEEGLFAGDVGVVGERHEVVGRQVGYRVEFFEMLGNTVAVVALPATMLRTPNHVDRPAVRSPLVTA